MHLILRLPTSLPRGLPVCMPEVEFVVCVLHVVATVVVVVVEVDMLADAAVFGV